MKTCNLINSDNSHYGNFLSSNQSLFTGCGSCSGNGVPQARGLQGGGGFGFGKNSVVGNHTMTPNKYDGCHVESDMKLGAGQVGGSRNPLAPTASDVFSQSTSVGYGYKTGIDNKMFAGSGYPKMNATTKMNSCQGGGKRRRTRKRKGGTIKKKGGFICKLFGNPKKGQKSRTRKGKKDFITHKGNKYFNRKGKRQKRAKKKTKKRRPYKKGRTKRRQRGGYRQFQSDIPLTHTMQTPNGSAGGTWLGQLTTPPTYKILNNCQDNYNHYKQK